MASCCPDLSNKPGMERENPSRYSEIAINFVLRCACSFEQLSSAPEQCINAWPTQENMLEWKGLIQKIIFVQLTLISGFISSFSNGQTEKHNLVNENAIQMHANYASA